MDRMPSSCAALAKPAHFTGVLKQAPFVLGRRASFWVSAAVVAHTLWTSAAPAMTYRLYAQDWHLSHTATTGIFAIYPVFVVATLLLSGGVSDHIGRRAALLTGLCASLAGALLFALAPDLWWLLAGRALMGIGVGLTAGPSAAAVIEYSAPGMSKHAAVVTTAAQSAGFASALLLGGFLSEYAPWPRHLTFWVLTALLAVLLIAAWFLPHQPCLVSTGRWRPRAAAIPASARKAFWIAAAAMTTAYTHGVLVLSLGGQVAHDLIQSSNAFLNGAVLSLFAIVSGLAGILGRRLSVRHAMPAGALGSAAGMGLLALSVAFHLLPVFLLATAMAGAGYGLLFLSALETINGAAPAQHRGGILSALFLLAYLALAVAALILGAIATARGLAMAVDLGAGTIGIMSLITLILATLPDRDAPPKTKSSRL